MSTALVKRNAPGRHVYDAIVLGGQLGGALAAGLLAKRGLTTLYVPHDGLGEGYAHQGQRLPHAPFLVPPIKSVAAFDEALTELGLQQQVSRALKSVPLQLLEADRWFELSHDEKHRGPELARAMGSQAEAFDEQVRKAQSAGDASDAFFAAKLEFPPEGFFGRWKFKRQVPRFSGLSHETPLDTTGLLSRLARFVTHVEQPSTLTRARTLGRALQGPCLYEGGREGLWTQLAERARELGADVLGPDEQIERVVFEGGLPGIRLVRGDTTYRAGIVLAAVDLDVLTRLVPENQRKAAAKAPASQANKGLVTFHLSLPEAALPRGLGRLALLDAPKLEGGVALLETLPGPSADQRILSVTLEAPLGLRAGGEPAVKALLAQVHVALERVMPFTRPHVTHESSPWFDAQHVVAGRGEPHPLFQCPADSWFGVTGLRTVSPWKRVFFAGRQVLPGLGFEGEVLAAQRAVRLAELTLKKNDPLKQRKTA